MSLKLVPDGSKQPTVLFDGDEIVYKCGFSAEEKRYTAYDADGTVIHQCRYKRDLIDYIKSEYEFVDIGTVLYDVETIVHPLETAITHVNSYINTVLLELQTNKYEVYLSNGGNFRDKIATLAPYKGNRINNYKPTHYDEIREYLIDTYRAILVDGMEADDALGIRQYEDFCSAEGDSSKTKTIVCSQDKDLLMIPGWNFNPNSRELKFITIDKAEFNFWHQVLTGDRADNIPGIVGLGVKTADKILQGYDKRSNHILPGATNRDELFSLIYNEYYEFYNGDDEAAVRHIDEVAKLLWILRKPGVTWDGTEV